MQHEGPQRFHSQALIEQLRYWLPSVRDVGDVVETQEDKGWRIFLVPHVEGACPCEVFLRGDGLFDIALGEDSAEACTVLSRGMIETLLNCVVSGQVRKRRWSLLGTGALVDVETLVGPQSDPFWRMSVRNGAMAAPFLASGPVMFRDRGYLPYRR